MELEEILDDLSVRFILPLTQLEKDNPERLYFTLEESYWLFIDCYVKKYKKFYLKFRDFCKALLIHNSLEYNENDYSLFKNYKKDIPVYGAIIVSKDFSKILLVKGHKSEMYFFPKGKKSFDETGKQCAEREVNEEIGLEVYNKLSSLCIITPRGTFFFCFNISSELKLQTNTRNEIDEIHWAEIDRLNENEEKYKVVLLYIDEIKEKIEFYKRVRVKFDLDKIRKKMNEVCNCKGDL
ncbi:mRNA decapping enzyme 2 [Tubulinosema ratisbonensis]|uniref:mRNA decapping enzyme 2 n=1 Tax=Tubulinosema ratisbonensis TaxID=291195 RepID=A0A437ALE4_9MICR|nr:mRNA decapping enzyme 2 [Tubulinosema ratisbonensis]